MKERFSEDSFPAYVNWPYQYTFWVKEYKYVIVGGVWTKEFLIVGVDPVPGEETSYEVKLTSSGSCNQRLKNKFFFKR